MATTYDRDTIVTLAHDILYDPAGSIALTKAQYLSKSNETYRKSGDDADMSGLVMDRPPLQGTSIDDQMPYSIDRVLHVLSDSTDTSATSMKTGAGIRVRTVPISAPNLNPQSSHNLTARRVYLGIPEVYRVAHPEQIYIQYTVDGNTYRGLFKVRPYKLAVPDSFTTPVKDEIGIPGAFTYYIVEGDGAEKLVNNGSTTVAYAISNIDITHLVTKIDGNKLYIDKSYPKVNDKSRILVTYRRLPSYNTEKLDEGSLTVYRKSRSFGRVGVEELKYGVDYNLNAKDWTLTNLTPQESVDSKTSEKLKVKFEYQQEGSNLYIYSAYFELDQPTSITLQDLDLQEEIGDRLFLKKITPEPEPMSDYTTTTEIKDLTKGIYKVIIYSKSIYRDGDEGSNTAIDTNSAAYKVITALDTENRKVFMKGNPYFKRQVGILKPAEEVSYHDLARNVPPESIEFFAIRNNTVYMVRDPYHEDFITPRYDTSGNLQLDGIEIQGRWAFKVASGEGVVDPTAVKLRATLLRDPSSDGDITPALKKYSIRFTGE